MYICPRKSSRLAEREPNCLIFNSLIMYNISIIESKGMQLFRDDAMIARKNVSQQEFEDLLGLENAIKIINACSKAALASKEVILKTPPSHQNRNFKPNTWNSNIQGAMIEEFPGNSGFCKGRRFYVEINGFRLFFKKVDRKLKPQNIVTKAVKMYDKQLSDNTEDTSPITFIGYQVSSTYTELTGVYAVHIINGTIEWYSDLAELVYVNSETIPLVSQSKKDEDISVVPKKGKRQNKSKQI